MVLGETSDKCFPLKNSQKTPMTIQNINNSKYNNPFDTILALCRHCCVIVYILVFNMISIIFNLFKKKKVFTEHVHNIQKLCKKMNYFSFDQTEIKLEQLNEMYKTIVFKGENANVDQLNIFKY